jgi:O-antigen ligase
MVTAFISPPLANLFELLLVLGMILGWRTLKTTEAYYDTFDFRLHLSFLIILLLGLFYSSLESEAFWQGLLSWRKFLLLPIGYLIFWKDTENKEKAIKMVFFMTLLLSIVGVIHKSEWIFFFRESVIHFQIGSTSSEAMIISVALAIVLSSWATGRPNLPMSQPFKIAVAVFLMVYVVLFTTGRSGYLALLMVIGLMTLHIIFRKKQNNLFKIVFLFLLFFSSLIGLSISGVSSQRIQQAENEIKQYHSEHLVDTSMGLRMVFWKHTFQMIPQYVWSGTGTGGFEKAYAAHVKPLQGLPEGLITQDPHNQYLKILIEQGGIGFLIFIAMLGRFLLQTGTRDELHWLGVMVTLVWMTTSLFNAHFSTFMEGTFIWAWIGCLNVLAKKV